MTIQLSEPCYESIRASLSDLLKEWKRLHQENEELKAAISELREVDYLYEVAETGPEYSNAYQRWQDAAKELYRLGER